MELPFAEAAQLVPSEEKTSVLDPVPPATKKEVGLFQDGSWALQTPNTDKPAPTYSDIGVGDTVHRNPSFEYAITAAVDDDCPLATKYVPFQAMERTQYSRNPIGCWDLVHSLPSTEYAKADIVSLDPPPATQTDPFQATQAQL
jgi:hypothetical protein